MNTVELPALDGRSPLGFLAALGLIQALRSADVGPLQLFFSRDRAVAQLHSPLRSVVEVVEKLQDLVSQSPDAAVVGLDPRFPFPAGQKGGDPMRRPRTEFRELTEEVRIIDARAASEWMPSLFTDLAVDSQERADLTPFCAPSGKQNLRTFFDKPLQAVRTDSSRLSDALTMWRRLDGFTGEYFDHRAINSAADDPGGRAGAERGVPGATWLATMAIPLMRLAGDGQRIEATLWYRVGRRSVMIWPLWDRPLTVPAIRVLIEHPCLTPIDDLPTIDGSAWPALGIFAVYGAERQEIPRRKFAGVLAPRSVEVRSN
jgi:hypothetical protein